MSLFIALSDTGFAQGVPEPSIILYGTVRNTALYHARVTSGLLIWTFRRIDTGRTLTLTTELGNVLGQFSYVLTVPCETQLSSPVSSNVLELVPGGIGYNRSNVVVAGYSASFVDPRQATNMLYSRNRGTIERVDLTIHAPCVDRDGLGVCDDWEIKYFGQIGYRPGDDEDKDGMTNLEEFIAGTNPNDPHSFFKFITYAPTPGGFQVQWNSAEGRSYSLLRSSTLLPGSFSVVRSNIVAEPPANTFLDTNATGSGPYFYDVLIQP